MGTVFLGRSAEGVPVAIKVIKPDLAEAPEFRARFRREAESARRVRRFTTAAVLDADPDGPQPYLVTEYVEGPTLSKMVARRGPLRPADLEQLALSVATALSAIHAAGIVHRDLTPANVLLSPVGPKVIDFGLARDFEGSGEFSRTARHAIGTPGYMAPEQILDAPVTSAADVFAWGAITIFAATGRPPFGEGRIEALLYRILYEPANIDGVPEELAPLVDAALQKEPDRRPTAEALRGALMSGDLTFNSAATLVGPGTGQPAGQEADRDAAQGGRRRRGSLFGRGGRDQDAQDAPVTAAPGTAQPTTATSATTSLLTPPPATTSRLPAAPAASPTTPASPIPAPPGSIRPPQTPTSPVPGGGPPRPTAKTPSGLPAGRQAPPVPPHPGPAAGGQHGAGDAPDDARRRSGRRKVVLVIAGLAALAVAAVAIPLALAGGSGDGGSNSAAGRAAVSTALARQAADVRAQDPAKASRLSLAAYRISPTDAATAAMAASFTAGSWVDLPGPATTYTGGAVSADGRLAAATDNAGRLRLWDLSNPDSPTQVADVATADAGAGAIAFDPRFLPSGILVTGGEAGHTWGLTDPKAPSVLGPLSPQTGDVARLAISGDGKLLATVDQDRTIELWDLSDPAKPRSLRPLQSTGLTTDIALSPDGHTLAVAGVGGAVTLFDVSNPMNPSRRGQAAGHLGQVNAVAFLADGSRLVTGGDDATVRLWDITDLANPRQVGAEWRGPSAGVLDVVPVGKSLVVSTDAGGALLGWDLTAAQAGPVGFALGGHATPRHVAAGGDGKWLLSVPTGTQAGAGSLGSTDPARLATLACLTSANRISAAEWASLGIDLAYEDPCAG